MSNLNFSRIIEIEEDAMCEHLMTVIEEIKEGKEMSAINMIESLIEEIKQSEAAQ